VLTPFAMTSAEIRQSFLDYFHRQGHTIVPSSSLLPDSPGLLFTNAGMNQFVPIFLNERRPDLSKWAGALPGRDTRAADTQKCIRAGGKHNDLEDVGWDTYHHTFFEMLGNWSFGDYFKKESLEWGWELLTRVWGIPPRRLFATVYAPDKAQGDPAEFDQEACDIWTGLFRSAGLDPALHIVHGNRKDNFWMMGDTGPCGPCSEIHFNLLADDDESAGRALVNSGSPRCIEIWNHVFIQFNAGADGSFLPLPAQHVDTGMGFERVAGIYATTKGFTDFSPEPSNYAADVFTTLFDVIARLSGHSYTATVPTQRENLTGPQRTDIAFRVLADHARTVSCAIADGILPGNEGRNYVIRRILRRGILYGRKDLGLATGFFAQLVPAVVGSLGAVFPELRERQDTIIRVIRSEEENFGRTLERGLQLFADEMARHGGTVVPGPVAFLLYDTYGFPLDMTQLLAAERGFSVDVAGFEAEMEKQRERARAAQKKEVIIVATRGSDDMPPTEFIGYVIPKAVSYRLRVLDVVTSGDDHFLVFDRTPFYAEMGGQMGDRGVVLARGTAVQIGTTLKDKSGRYLHKVSNVENHFLPEAPRGAVPVSPRFLHSLVGETVEAGVNMVWRREIQRHHTATHLLHWALRRVLGFHVRQAGSAVHRDSLRFDFSHFEQVKPEQLREVERLVNQRILDNASVSAAEVPYAEVSGRKDVMQFFGDKYGDRVRVVQIGGDPARLNGYSMELCGGTHVNTTGEIGLFRISLESAIAAGTRRIEAIAGDAAYRSLLAQEDRLHALARKLNVTAVDVERRLDALLAQRTELERQLRSFQQKAAAHRVDELVAGARDLDGVKRVVAKIAADNPEDLRAFGTQLIARLGEGVAVLGAAFEDKVTVAAWCSPQAIKAGHQAGKIVAALCAQLGGKGGGKPEFAMGGGKDPSKLDAVLATL
jgi:alanyl-tRNA synthetase